MVAAECMVAVQCRGGATGGARHAGWLTVGQFPTLFGTLAWGPRRGGLQAELDAALTRQQELQAEARQAGEAAAGAQADAEAVTRERDQAVKQAKSEASRKERDMLASHTSEVGSPRPACVIWVCSSLDTWMSMGCHRAFSKQQAYT